MSAPPPPLRIARSFLIHYYQTLSTSPPTISQFYSPHSVISHSSSLDAPPSTCSRNALSLDWAEGCHVDFDKGSIDAQTCVDGGILVVVTGEMSLKNNINAVGGDNSLTGTKKRMFVQTFVLVDEGKGGKKCFFVRNDVLRFLNEAAEEEEEEELPPQAEEIEVVDVAPDATSSSPKMDEVTEEMSAAVISSTAATAAPSALEEPVIQEETVTSVPAAPVPLVNEEAEIVPVKREEDVTPTPSLSTPAGSTQPSPSPSPTPLSSEPLNPPAPPVSSLSTTSKSIENDTHKDDKITNDSEMTNDITKTNNRPSHNHFVSNAHSTTPTTNNMPTKSDSPPGSWASLVAKSGLLPPPQSASPPPPPSPTPPTTISSSAAGGTGGAPRRPPLPSSAGTKQHSAGTAMPGGSGPSASSQGGRSSPAGAPYEPMSLYIKNISESTRESDLRNMFSEFQFPIVNVNLYPQRGFAFVDFDSPTAVSTIMSVPRRWEVRGRILEVEKKSGKKDRRRRSTDSRGAGHYRGGGRGRGRG